MARLAVLFAVSWEYPRSMGASLRQSLRSEGLGAEILLSLDAELQAQNVLPGQRPSPPTTLDSLLSQADMKEQQSPAQQALLLETLDPVKPGSVTLDSLFSQAAMNEKQSHAQEAQLEETTLSEASPQQASSSDEAVPSEALPVPTAGAAPMLQDVSSTEANPPEALPGPTAEAAPMPQEAPSTETTLSEAVTAPAAGTEVIPSENLPAPPAGTSPMMQVASPTEAVLSEGVLAPAAETEVISSETLSAPTAEATPMLRKESSTQAVLSEALLEPTAAGAAEKPGEATGVDSVASGSDDQSHLMSLEQQERLQLAKPITWFHVPKCGTTFANTLFHHPKICPKFPEKELISRVKAGIPGDMLQMILGSPGMYGVDIGKFNPDSIDDLCDRSIDTRLQGLGHNAIGQHWSEVAGHSMIFLRQPEQRIISAYRHGRHGCLTCDHETTISEYAPLAAGCVTRMLTREGDDACVNAQPPTLPEMALAIQRLRSGFIFVGITEQWDMSICLFHAKYGGQCNAYEMVNTRPGRYLSTDHPSYYDTEELGGFTDVFDRQLYMEAMAMFEEDIERFGLTREYCTQACGGQ